MTTTTTAGAVAGKPLRFLSRHSGLSFFPIALVARLPIAMLTLGISAYVAAVRDSIADGGLAGGCYALGAAIGGPLAGSCADRFGQRRVGYVLLVANALAVASVIATAAGQLPLLLAVTALTGLTVIPVGPFARVRWTTVIDAHVPADERTRVKGAAFGYETLADELTFVFGPVIVGILSYAAASTPLVACIAIVVVFGFLFSRHRSAQMVPRVTAQSASAAPLTTLLRSDRFTLIATMTVIGALLGCQVTSVIAFAQEHGAISNAGLIYAGFGVGSGAASIGVGLIQTSTSLYRRWLAAAALAVAVSAAMVMVTETWLLAAVLALLGLGIGPIIVTVYQLAGEHTPAGRDSLYMSTLSSALIGGNAIGAALAGVISEEHGSRWGFAIIVVLSIGLGALAAVSRWASKWAPRRTADTAP
ncbi:hypothetical protein A5699_20495 [Mycobacterium sp. E802]|uniref:MFS transporter n=1 Tax=Mycobacterium sp. E802 TaxID=1834152 RepID=UPI0007FF15BA|nr:MFS transporter [Mycobacterium sp. E802]OBG86803.1 hypothetical protein A5699_20495 [Mycobacterium sp. E802]